MTNKMLTKFNAVNVMFVQLVISII